MSYIVIWFIFGIVGSVFLGLLILKFEDIKVDTMAFLVLFTTTGIIGFLMGLLFLFSEKQNFVLFKQKK